MQDTIAVIFDFDDTLAPDSTSSFLHYLGVDVKDFWQNKVQNLIKDGWDPIPAYLYMMIKEANSGDNDKIITKNKLASWGKQIQFYTGATRIFNRLKRVAQTINQSTSVEFYLISSGIGDILRSTTISHQFSHIWASDFVYGEDGNIIFPKKIVSFTDKTRYIFHASKGIIGPESSGKPFEVNRKIKPQELRIPLDQIIYVGDGYTDIPCFSLIRKNNGVAIGVYEPEDRKRWGKAWGFIEDGRVSNLVPADYGKNSALTNSLTMAIQSIARKIDLRRNTYQG